MEVFENIVKAFFVGGLFCVVGQILIDKTNLTPARILVAYVVAGVILGGLGLYEPLVKFAGAGASVPLTGFGNTLAKGVRDAVDTQSLWGALTGGLKATAGGIAAAIFFGLVMGIIFKSKEKNST
ncbi:MAG: stage V sporulation protein AE [Oscillospiraceae bacterium]|nr:stage V sporulation protein AE [Oscillospiraceae bacterium]